MNEEDIQEIWSLLDALNPTTDHFKARELANIELVSGHILLGLDSQHHRHLLIPIAQNVKIITDKRSSGVQIIPHPWMEDGILRSFVDLVCLKPQLNHLFSILVNEILTILVQDPGRPDYICRQVLDRWRELLEREASGLLAMEKIVGVFGELWFLREIVQSNPNAVQCWVGPMGARHDFSAGVLALEIKSTLSRQGRFVEIHGHEQLEPPENGNLYLGVLKLELEPTSGESLQDLLEAIVQYGGDRYTLFNRLAQIDSSLLTLEKYKEIRFRLCESRFYEVNENFPRITSKSFIGNAIPNGIRKITYQIDLSTEPPEPLDSNAIYEVVANLIS